MPPFLTWSHSSRPSERVSTSRKAECLLLMTTSPNGEPGTGPGSVSVCLGVKARQASGPRGPATSGRTWIPFALICAESIGLTTM